MRSKDNYKIVTSASQRHLLKLRYIKAECLHCKKHCPYFMHVISGESADEVVVDEDIQIIILDSCCDGTILVCEFCVDLFRPECPQCIDCKVIAEYHQSGQAGAPLIRITE